MESLINDILNLPDNTHVQIERYREFYHVIVYKAKEGCHITTPRRPIVGERKWKYRS
jgi:hypothetical protein